MTDRNPAVAIEEIRDGAQQCLLIVRRHLGEIAESLDRGAFMEAHKRSGELYQRLGYLGAAEANLATLTRSTAVRAVDVEVGMHIGRGPITDKQVERHQCLGHEGDHVIVTLKWGDDEEYAYDGDAELIVRHTD